MSAKYLYGASGHCKVIIDILKSNNETLDAVLDDYPKIEKILDIPVKPAFQEVLSLSDNIIISIGDNSIRKKIVSNIKASFFTAIHTNTILSESSKINIGTVVMAGVVINSSVEIGKHCIVNTGAIVEHDCKIEDYCHISPNVSLAGSVSVGEGTHLGIGSCVIQGIKIGKWVKIGAGAVIINDVPDYAVVVGNPGKIIKYNKSDE